MLVNSKNTKQIIRILGLLALIVALILVVFYFHKKTVSEQPLNEAPAYDIPASSTVDNLKPQSDFSLPIAEALSRVTKKTFGIYVSPNNSPVSPEKFTGYHTGVDFETTPSEQDIEVPIYAICDGSLILKKTATGYGGVAVEACLLDGQAITVIYGHLKLSSIKLAINDQLKAGEQLGVLGKGYSVETSGERKHLHLGIHRGAAVNLLGYVSKQNDLDAWLDFLTVIK